MRLSSAKAYNLNQLGLLYYGCERYLMLGQSNHGKLDLSNETRRSLHDARSCVEEYSTYTASEVC